MQSSVLNVTNNIEELSHTLMEELIGIYVEKKGEYPDVVVMLEKQLRFLFNLSQTLIHPVYLDRGIKFMTPEVFKMIYRREV